MHRLLINLYELGQFLRILLWISVPMVVISMLVTTWLHYRRKRRLSEHWVPAMLLSTGEEISGTGQEPLESGSGSGSNGDTLEPEEKEHIYKGILWMKEKYEQYRDMADKRYEQLKEEMARTEKKYNDLLESGVRPAG